LQGGPGPLFALPCFRPSIHPHPDLASGVIYAKTTTKVWNDLKERFSKGSESKTFLSFKI